MIKVIFKMGVIQTELIMLFILNKLWLLLKLNKPREECLNYLSLYKEPWGHCNRTDNQADKQTG